MEEVAVEEGAWLAGQTRAAAAFLAQPQATEQSWHAHALSLRQE